MPPKKRSQAVKGAKNGTPTATVSSGRVTRAKKAPVVAATAKASPISKKKATATPTSSSPRTKKAKKTAINGRVGRVRHNTTSEYDYYDVEASWDTRVEYSIVAETATGGTITLEGSVNGTGPLEETDRIAQLFDGATARNLILIIRDDATKAVEYYSAIFGNLQYKHLTIKFDGEHDHSKFFQSFFPLITKGRDLSNGKLVLEWECQKAQTLPLLRQTLCKMPKVNELEIECNFWDMKGNDNHGVLLDDATLRHVVANSNDAKLGHAFSVSAQGVLDAFEEVCKGANKNVMLELKDPLVDEIFRLGESQKNNGYQMNSTVLHRRLHDAKRGKMLVEWGKNCTETTPIVMQRENLPAPKAK